MTSAAGLPNWGNTCYLNATLQCLRHSDVFLRELKGLTAQSSTKTRREDHPDVELLVALTDVLSQNSTARYTRLLRAVQLSFPSSFRAGRQNDAHEFMELLLDRVDRAAFSVVEAEEAKPRQHEAEAVAKTDAVGNFCRKMSDAWTKYVCPSSTIHHRAVAVAPKTFGGLLVSQIRCGGCGKTFHTPEPFGVLPISLPSDGTVREKQQRQPCSVHQLLKRFCGRERLCQWRCEACHNVGGERVYRMWTAPRQLVVVLKRFTNSGDKVSTPVIVNHTLDVAELVSSVCAPFGFPRVYELRSVVCHIGEGSAAGGHYVTVGALRNVMKDGAIIEWTRYDDDRVSKNVQSASTTWCSRDAYILLYDGVR